MTQEEKKQIKNFISYCKDEHIPLNKKDDIFTGNDKEITMKVLNFIMSNECFVLEYFSFYNFLKPLIRKLGRKLFYYGMITADKCLYYENISITWHKKKVIVT